MTNLKRYARAETKMMHVLEVWQDHEMPEIPYTVLGGATRGRAVTYFQLFGFGRLVVDSTIKPYAGEPWGVDGAVYEGARPRDYPERVRMLVEMEEASGVPPRVVLLPQEDEWRRDAELVHELAPEWPLYADLPVGALPGELSEEDEELLAGVGIPHVAGELGWLREWKAWAVQRGRKLLLRKCNGKEKWMEAGHIRPHYINMPMLGVGDNLHKFRRFLDLRYGAQDGSDW